MSISLGKVIKHTASEYLELECENGYVRLSIANDYALRVQIGPKTAPVFRTFSYAVDNLTETCPQYQEDQGNLILNTPYYQVYVALDHFKLRFFTLDGKPIQEDDDLGYRFQGQTLTAYKKLKEEEKFIGLGEKSGDLNRRGNQYTHWNTDAFGYGNWSDPLYASIPFYIGIQADMPYGIFLDNHSKTDFNFGASNDRFSFFRSHNEQLDYYFFYTGNIQGILDLYTELTGRPELPPMWALGYHQCRYSYYPQGELELLADGFRKKDIPADVLYLDIHYMDEYKIFTWNKERFPNPEKFLSEMEAKGFKIVVIHDPGIKKEEGYAAFDEGVQKGYFVCYPDGQPYTGEAWPGKCYFPDFTREDVRNWWAEKMQEQMDQGVAGFWNDMNEPAVWGKHFPDVVEFNLEGTEGTHAEAHNVYGMQMVRSTYESQKNHQPELRPFALTRAAYAGTQRYSWIWTGDNISTDDHIHLGQRLINSLGLSGYSYAGNDVGGFIGECSPELFARWIAVGAFNPFYRGHSMVNSRDHEPWSFGEEVEDISRNFIKLRYQLLPYLYTAFYQSTVEGLPVNRSLAIKHYACPETFSGDYQNQFYCGDQLLICPILPNKEFAKIWLPQGEWIEFFSDEKVAAGKHVWPLQKDRIPVFVKASSALFTKEAAANTQQQTNLPLQIHLYPGTENNQGIFYTDSGEGYGYAEGEHILLDWKYNAVTKSWTFAQTSGDMIFNVQECTVYLHTEIYQNQININGMVYNLVDEKMRWIAPISDFDPYYKGGKPDNMLAVKRVVFQ